MKSGSKNWDAIVVGSGPGGATVAKELADGGKRVLILEWGDNAPVKGTLSQAVRGAFIPGKSLLVTGQMLGMVRGITTGGSSLFYCATAFKPPVDMLKAYGVDITGEFAELKNDVPMAPLPDELDSPAAQRFSQSALDLGYDCRKMDKFIYPDKCRTDCQLCSYGCPYGAKWTARNFVDHALKNGACIINHAKVNRVIIENRQAIGVEYKHNMKQHRVYAPRIIVAAGGIGSPVILRRSGIQNVGRDFFFDPLWYVMGKVNITGSGKGVPMTYGIHFEEDGIVLTDFNLPHILKTFFDLELLKIRQLFSYRNVIPIMIKIRDQLGGRVTDNGLIWKTLSRSDRQKLEKGAQHATRILKNAGATETYRSWVVAAHPGGTVKIGEHVDKNLKTEFDNLYVCDCSVIPEEWGLPPTVTLLSLGKRLAKHLL